MKTFTRGDGLTVSVGERFKHNRVRENDGSLRNVTVMEIQPTGRMLVRTDTGMLGSTSVNNVPRWTKLAGTGCAVCDVMIDGDLTFADMLARWGAEHVVLAAGDCASCAPGVAMLKGAK